MLVLAGSWRSLYFASVIGRTFTCTAHDRIPEGICLLIFFHHCLATAQTIHMGSYKVIMNIPTAHWSTYRGWVERIRSFILDIMGSGLCSQTKVKLSHCRPWAGPWGSRRLRLPGFLNSRHLKVVGLSALRTGRLYPPGKIPGAHFCQAESNPGPQCGQKD